MYIQIYSKEDVEILYIHKHIINTYWGLRLILEGRALARQKKKTLGLSPHTRTKRACSGLRTGERGRLYLTEIFKSVSQYM
jgi:hypothetical protein